MTSGNSGYSTPAHLATRPGRATALSALLRHGGPSRVSAAARDSDGNNVLHSAVRAANPLALKALVASLPDCDPCAMNKAGQTPMLMAIDAYREMTTAPDKETKGLTKKDREERERVAGDLWECVSFLMLISKKQASVSEKAGGVGLSGGETAMKKESKRQQPEMKDPPPEKTKRTKISFQIGAGKKKPPRPRSPIRAPSPGRQWSNDGDSDQTYIFPKRNNRKEISFPDDLPSDNPLPPSSKRKRSSIVFYGEDFWTDKRPLFPTGGCRSLLDDDEEEEGPMSKNFPGF